MTDTDLTAMEALAAKATAGPWNSLCEWKGESCRAGVVFQRASAFDYDGPMPFLPDDAAFIGACRQFVPDAIAEIRRLRAMLVEAATIIVTREGEMEDHHAADELMCLLECSTDEATYLLRRALEKYPGLPIVKTGRVLATEKNP